VARKRANGFNKKYRFLGGFVVKKILLLKKNLVWVELGGRKSIKAVSCPRLFPEYFKCGQGKVALIL
jgi:hypothetical protein